MSFNNTSCLSSYNNQLPPNTNCIDERDRFFKFKQIHQKNLPLDLHNIIIDYLNLNSSTPNRTSEDWRAHIILENFANRALTTWSLEKIKNGLFAAVNEDDVCLLSVLLQITRIRNININTLFPDIRIAEYKHENGIIFKLNFLHLAVDNKKHRTLQYMLESNLFDVNFKTCSLSLLKKYDRTPLHFAAINLDLKAITLLLNTKGIELKSYDLKNYTPFESLLWKDGNNKSVCIELFRNVSENTFLKMCNGFTLISACFARSNEICKYLIPHLEFNDINYQAESYGWTPLFSAVLNLSDDSVIQALLNHPKINVNMRTFYKSSKMTPLHMALKINNMQAFTHLVNYPKTNVNRCETYDNDYYFRIDGTPIVSAVRLNNVNAVKLLLKNKADLLSCSYRKVGNDHPYPVYGENISIFQIALNNKNSEIFQLLEERALRKKKPEVLKLLNEAKGRGISDNGVYESKI